MENEIVKWLDVIIYLSFMPMMCFYILHENKFGRILMGLIMMCFFASTLLISGMEKAVLYTSLIALSPMIVPFIVWPIQSIVKKGVEHKYGKFKHNNWPGLFAGYKIL